MKENPMIRTAVLVLVLILLSTCCIGGTFAKYTTGAMGADSARVAKWDITRDFQSPDPDGGHMFKAEYADTVSSANGDHVVAPGTSKSYVYGLTGAPEVAYTIYMGIQEDSKDVTLNPGTYTFADPYQEMTVTVEKEYLPLKWTVTLETANGTLVGPFSSGEAKEFGSLAEIRETLTDVTVSYDTNEECDLDVTLSWVWDFEEPNGTYSLEDKMDTVLGYYISLARNTIDTQPFTTEDGSAVTDVSYTFTLTAVQVD